MKKFRNGKKLGDKMYPWGVQITLPQYGSADDEVVAETFTFKGSFDRRKLRKMVKQTINPALTTDEADWIIENFSTKLRPVTMEEVIAQATEGDNASD